MVCYGSSSTSQFPLGQPGTETGRARSGPPDVKAGQIGPLNMASVISRWTGQIDNELARKLAELH